MTDLNQNQATETNQEQTSLLSGGHEGEIQDAGDQGQTTEETTTTGAPESIDGYEVAVEGFNYDEFKAIPENQEFLAKLSLAKPATSAGVQLFNEPCGLIKL